MILKKILLVWMILSAGISIAGTCPSTVRATIAAMEREPEIFAAIRYNMDFASFSLEPERQAFYAQQVNMRGHRGMSPLLFAIVLNKPVSMLTWLITQGADVNANRWPDRSFDTSILHEAACKGYTEAIELLLNHNADCLRTDRDGNTALQCAKKVLAYYPFEKIQAMVDMLEIAERQQRAWDAKKTWIAGVYSHVKD